MRISESELEIMEVIWKLDRPVQSQELMAELSEKHWKPTTLLTFLSRLCEKGVLSMEKMGRANKYNCVISKEEYQQLETQDFMEQVHSGSVQSLFAALVKSKSLSRDDLDELSHWLEEQ